VLKTSWRELRAIYRRGHTSALGPDSAVHQHAGSVGIKPESGRLAQGQQGRRSARSSLPSRHARRVGPGVQGIVVPDASKGEKPSPFWHAPRPSADLVLYFARDCISPQNMSLNIN
jgi:hypothetical protein